MAQQLINIGTAANDGTGDSLRAAGGKINSNFTELYGRTAYTLPIATNATLGGVKVGDTLQINASTGVLSLNASLDNLTDVAITSLASGQILINNGTNFINSTPLYINFNGKYNTDPSIAGVRDGDQYWNNLDSKMQVYISEWRELNGAERFKFQDDSLFQMQNDAYFQFQG